MMFNYPYIGYPFYNNYNRYSSNYTNNPWHNQSIHKKSNKNNLNNNNDTNLLSSSNENNKYKNNCNNEKNNTKSKLDHIDILGIDLYFDDILLILLIYFLYTEGVKDIYLFFVLVLLLLT